jgi:hypothetical protein
MMSCRQSFPAHARESATATSNNSMLSHHRSQQQQQCSRSRNLSKFEAVSSNNDITCILRGKINGSREATPASFQQSLGGILCAASDGVTQQYESTWKDAIYSTTPSNPNSRSTSFYLAPSPVSEGITDQDHDNDLFDWTRFVAAGVIGVFFGGYVYPFAYAKLDAIWVGTAVTTVMKKSIVEIATVGIFVNSCSMTSRGLCRGDKDPNTVAIHVAQELPVVTKNDFLVWFPYNCMAFSIIPAFIRPFSTLMMEASWQGYISFRSHDFQKM